MLIVAKSQYIRLDDLIVELYCGLKKKKFFLEGFVDHVIYRDYIVNRRFFIYSSLATADAKCT